MTHADIIARLTAATGPDIALDAEIAATLGIVPHTTVGSRKIPFIANGETWPAYSASLDATVALIERVLPGWMVHIWRYGAVWQVSMSEHPGLEPRYQGLALTEPLARLLALFRAFEAQEAASV